MARTESESDLPASPVHKGTREVILAAEAVLKRVPGQFVAKGRFDAPFVFSAEELSAGVSRGRVTVSLGALAAMQPAYFTDAARALEGIEIALPLKEIVAQYGEFPMTQEPVIEGPDLLVERKPTPGRETVSARISGVRIALDFRVIAAELPDLASLMENAQTFTVSLPLAHVEEQLGTGKVTIPVQDLLMQLPPKFRTPIANLGLNDIPIPLGEIFRNLPGGATPAKKTAPPSPDDQLPPSPPESPRHLRQRLDP